MTTTPTSGAAGLPEAGCSKHHLIHCSQCRHDNMVRDLRAENDRLTTQLAALAAGQATAAQQGVAYAALPESFLEIPDVQDESGINTYYSREVVLECIDAALASHGQAPAEVSPTAGMSIPQRILHVGGRDNAAGYVEFGSIQAVEALVRQVLRDLPSQQPAPSPAETVGNSGFDYQTAADVLNGKTVSDEAIRKFVAASRWAHDDRAGLRATLLSVRGELASREAEILLLKNALMGAEGPQPSTTAQADTQPAPVLWVSPEQFANFVDTDEAEFGKYIPARKTSAGKFTMPLFAARAPADSVQEDAARYRLLRNKSHVVHNKTWLGGISAHNRDGDFLCRDDALAALDTAIDAARKQGENHDR